MIKKRIENVEYTNKYGSSGPSQWLFVRM